MLPKKPTKKPVVSPGAVDPNQRVKLYPIKQEIKKFEKKLLKISSLTQPQLKRILIDLDRLISTIESQVKRLEGNAGFVSLTQPTTEEQTQPQTQTQAKEMESQVILLEKRIEEIGKRLKKTDLSEKRLKAYEKENEELKNQSIQLMKQLKLLQSEDVAPPVPPMPSVPPKSTSDISHEGSKVPKGPPAGPPKGPKAPKVPKDKSESELTIDRENQFQRIESKLKSIEKRVQEMRKLLKNRNISESDLDELAKENNAFEKQAFALRKQLEILLSEEDIITIE